MADVAPRRAGGARRGGWAAWLGVLLLLATLGLAACDAPRPAPVGDGETAGAEAGEALRTRGGKQRSAARSAEVDHIARTATWTAGQLQSHFAKHGREGPYPTPEEYDASARETVRVGKDFGYVDRTTHARRRGFYDPATNRFTAVTTDGRRITTHFRPDSGEHYVKGLLESTYR